MVNGTVYLINCPVSVCDINSIVHLFWPEPYTGVVCNCVYLCKRIVPAPTMHQGPPPPS